LAASLKEDNWFFVTDQTPCPQLFTFTSSGKPPNITLRVISRIEQPFVMFKKQKEGEEVLIGNDRFEASHPRTACTHCMHLNFQF
jgi:hypothetical protein